MTVPPHAVDSERFLPQNNELDPAGQVGYHWTSYPMSRLTPSALLSRSRTSGSSDSVPTPGRGRGSEA